MFIGYQTLPRKWQPPYTVMLASEFTSYLTPKMYFPENKIEERKSWHFLLIFVLLFQRRGDTQGSLCPFVCHDYNWSYIAYDNMVTLITNYLGQGHFAGVFWQSIPGWHKTHLVLQVATQNTHIIFLGLNCIVWERIHNNIPSRFTTADWTVPSVTTGLVRSNA